SDPFRLRVANAMLTDRGMEGSLEREGRRYAWDLRWEPHLDAYGHVHPALRAAKVAKTILFLPHPDVEVTGTIDVNGRTIEIAGARGGQAHLWGAKHASRWAWVHCSDFNGSNGSLGGAFVDGVSVYVPRFGRELGPNT